MIGAAFYAPLKSPNHSNPSGDREIARSLLRALEHAGFSPTLASDLRLIDRVGDADIQARLITQANALVPELVARGKSEAWRFWLTYHNYYKAPDLLGPTVADLLEIPYVQVESTRSRKRLAGPWAAFAQAAEAAADAAAAIFYLTHRDAEALREYGPSNQRLAHLSPFLPQENLPAPSNRDGPMLAVGMMRRGDKLASYQLLAETLALLGGSWKLDIAGDGNARNEVEALMAPFGEKVRFLGQLDRAGINRIYARAKLMIWPGVNEAIGMTYVEAQSFGIPVLAQDRPGLRDVIAPSLLRPAPELGARGLADVLSLFTKSPPVSDEIRQHVGTHHLLGSAAETLKNTIVPLIDVSK